MLDILIPTYKRPDTVINTITKILSTNDNRIKIYCNSNGIEEKLEHFKYHEDSRLIYSNFEKSCSSIMSGLGFVY